MNVLRVGLATASVIMITAGTMPRAMATEAPDSLDVPEAPAENTASWQEWTQQNPTYRQLIRQYGKSVLMPPPVVRPSRRVTPRPVRGQSQPPRVATGNNPSRNWNTNPHQYSANLQAFLRVIRHAEGTNSEEGYQIKFTSRRFSSFADHPRQVMCSSFRQRRLCSTAAGAYQFLDTTWDQVASQIGAPDFSPQWQDRGAVALLERAGVLPLIESGQIEAAIARTAKIWASFPRYMGDGQGVYSQAVKPMGELLHVFNYYRNWYEQS
jgi:muramidase (phage lysozyme)